MVMAGRAPKKRLKVVNMAAPVGVKHHQILVLIRREGGKLVREERTPCVFVPLIGMGGWEEAPSSRDDPCNNGGTDASSISK